MGKKVLETEPTSIRLTVKLRKHLDKLAAKHKWSRNKYIENALIKYSNFKDEEI